MHLRKLNKTFFSGISSTSSIFENFVQGNLFAVSNSSPFSRKFLVSLRSCTSIRLYTMTQSKVEMCVQLERPNRKIEARSILLTPDEVKLFDIVRAAVAKYAPGTTVRVAGGWVRDKLWQLDNDDIDLVSDKLSGTQFAEVVVKYLKDIGEITHSVGVIESNPDQSKHLETATTMVLGMWIDFAQLRKETYAENSRIPVTEHGTPLEDSLRRDFTINSLFYNVTSNRFEDYTGYGVDDMNSRILRTPLDPRTTYLDDPLRVLRAIRFATRYNIRIEDSSVESIMDPDVLSGLREKVSRERIGIEVKKMLSGAHPISSLRAIKTYELFPIVFLVPNDISVVGKLTTPAEVRNPSDLSPVVSESFEQFSKLPTYGDSNKGSDVPNIWNDVSMTAVESFAYLAQVVPEDLYSARRTKPFPTFPPIGFSTPLHNDHPEATEDNCLKLKLLGQKEKLQLMLSLVLLPWELTHFKLGKKRPEPSIIVMASDHLRMSKEIASGTFNVLVGSRMFLKVISDLKAQFGESITSLSDEQLLSCPDISEDIGLCFRSIKDCWRLSWLVMISRLFFPILYATENYGCLEVSIKAQNDLQRIMDESQVILRFITLWDLEKSWERKPLLDGVQIKELLNIQGKHVSDAVAFQTSWMLRNPTGSVEDLKVAYVDKFLSKKC